MSKHEVFSPLERGLSFLAGLANLIVGLGFFFLPELHPTLWPTTIPVILDRFSSMFWIYFAIDVPFLLVYFALFIYHDIAPRMAKRAARRTVEQARD